MGENICRIHHCASFDRNDSGCRNLRDAAYHELKASVDTIRAWSHLLFKKGTREYQAFTSAFYRERNAKAQARAAAQLQGGSVVDGDVVDRERIERLGTLANDSVAIVANTEQANQAREYPLRLIG